MPIKIDKSSPKNWVHIQLCLGNWASFSTLQRSVNSIVNFSLGKMPQKQLQLDQILFAPYKHQLSYTWSKFWQIIGGGALKMCTLSVNCGLSAGWTAKRGEWKERKYEADSWKSSVQHRFEQHGSATWVCHTLQCISALLCVSDNARLLLFDWNWRNIILNSIFIEQSS